MCQLYILQAEELLGSAATYSIIEWCKDNIEDLIVPEELPVVAAAQASSTVSFSFVSELTFVTSVVLCTGWDHATNGHQYSNFRIYHTVHLFTP